MFFCEYCKIFKNTYFEKNLRTAAFYSNNSDFNAACFLPFSKISKAHPESNERNFKEIMYKICGTYRWEELGQICWWRSVCIWCNIYKSSHHRCSIETGVVKNSTKFTRKRLWQSLFFNKVAGLWSLFLIKLQVCNFI